MSMAKNLRALLRDTSGTSLVEMGAIVPALALLVCGATDMAMGFAQKLKDQQAADRAVNFALAVGLSNATIAGIQGEAATAAGLQSTQVTVNEWLECSGVVQSDINATCSSGTPARFVSVSISDSYASLFGGLIGTRSIPLSTYAEVRLQ